MGETLLFAALGSVLATLLAGWLTSRKRLSVIVAFGIIALAAWTWSSPATAPASPDGAENREPTPPGVSPLLPPPKGATNVRRSEKLPGGDPPPRPLGARPTFQLPENWDQERRADGEILLFSRAFSNARILVEPSRPLTGTFAEMFNAQLGSLEPLPGIPPTSKIKIHDGFTGHFVEGVFELQTGGPTNRETERRNFLLMACVSGNGYESLIYVNDEYYYHPNKNMLNQFLASLNYPLRCE